MLVTAAIIEGEGRVLIAKRRPGKHMGSRWEFPGGKIEPGESPEESLARELLEELGVQARIGEFLSSCSYEGDGVSLELLVYRAGIISGIPQLLEHQEILWVRPADLLSYDLADSDRKIVENLFPGG
jgi:8-oxo-dGTP diphosphatase